MRYRYNKAMPIKAPRESDEISKTLVRRYGVHELRSVLNDLKLQLAMGASDIEIMEKLSTPEKAMTANILAELRKELVRQEIKVLYNKSTEEVFLDYAWRQEQCVKDLDDTIEKIKTSNQHNAMVGAVRAKSDIIDKIIKTGQDMGVLEKAPERKLVLKGVAIAGMDTKDLRKLISQETEGLSMLLSKYGNADMDGNPIDDTAPAVIDVPSQELLPAPAQPEFKAESTKRVNPGAARAKAGRRRHAVQRQKATASG